MGEIAVLGQRLFTSPKFQVISWFLLDLTLQGLTGTEGSDENAF
jgi:hypothetical protein